MQAAGAAPPSLKQRRRYSHKKAERAANAARKRGDLPAEPPHVTLDDDIEAEPTMSFEAELAEIFLLLESDSCKVTNYVV